MLARERHTAQLSYPFPMEVRLGVSACLVCERVRWDGGEKRDARVMALGDEVELIPFCPEVELGLGVPRPPIDLVNRGGRITLEGDNVDHTDAMRELARDRVAALIEARVSGYILKSRSPSCGLRDVPVRIGADRVEAGARGLFAATLAAEIEGLPLVDERGLGDPRLCASFAVRVAAWARTAAIFGFGLERRWKRSELVAHHSREKLLLLAHSSDHYRSLGVLVAEAAQHEPRSVARRYRTELMEALETPPSLGRHVNALQHIAGYFDGADRRAVNEAVTAFAGGAIELASVRATLRSAAERRGHSYLARQSYLATDPVEAVIAACGPAR